MKHRLPRKKDKVQPLNSTFALAEEDQTDLDTGTTIPSEDGVKEAKDWVEHNKK